MERHRPIVPESPIGPNARLLMISRDKCRASGPDGKTSEITGSRRKITPYCPPQYAIIRTVSKTIIYDFFLDRVKCQVSALRPRQGRNMGPVGLHDRYGAEVPRLTVARMCQGSP